MHPRRSLAALACLALLAGLITSTTSAAGSIRHRRVVSENPVNFTPHLVQTGRERPLALAVGQLAGTTYVGGRFNRVQNAGRTASARRRNLVAFDATSGRINRNFKPRFDDQVFAVRASGRYLFVGGSFDTVNGARREALVKLNARTGRLIRQFRPAIGGGRVSEIRLVDGRLLVAGTFGRNLVALNPRTGRNTRYLDIAINGKLPTTSKTEVYRFAVNPAHTRLVGVGNFTTVGGQNRKRAFMLELRRRSARVGHWYYRPLRDRCGSNPRNPSKQPYLEDVDFAPNGNYFVFASTGFVPRFRRQIGTHLCDAAARFETNRPSPRRPTWINYTGGDSLHAVAATGAAVYVQGHQRWLNNPRGRNSAGPGAVVRRGIGAINPRTGKALRWNPPKPARQGGQDFLVTGNGLWVPSDSERFNGERHRAIAFVRLR